MNLRAEHGVYLALGFVVVAFLVLFFFMGPLGWILDVLFLLAVFKLAGWSGFFRATPSQSKRNCPDCGARNSVDDASCSYCGEPLTDAR